MRPNDLCVHLLGGMQAAQREYVWMSNGYWLWSGAEYFLTSSLAKHLHSTDPANVFCTVEESLHNFSFGRGRPNYALRIGGRTDIAVWDSIGNSIGIVEVKVQKASSICGEDLDRLVTFSGRTISLGAFAYYYSFSAPTPERVEIMCRRRLNAINHLANEYAEYGGVNLCSQELISETVDEDGSFSNWLGFACVFSQ